MDKSVQGFFLSPMKEDALQRLSGSEFRAALLLNGTISRLRQEEDINFL